MPKSKLKLFARFKIFCWLFTSVLLVTLIVIGFQNFQFFTDATFADSRVDVTNCSVLTPPTKLTHGLWAGPWVGSEFHTLMPDTNTVYFKANLPFLPPDTSNPSNPNNFMYFEIEGVYPDARYMSYHLYDQNGVYEDHLRDVAPLTSNPSQPDPTRSVMPLAGSVNSFVTGYPLPALSKRQYRVSIIDQNKVNLPGGSVLHGGAVANGAPPLYHALMLRYYDPTRSSSSEQESGIYAGMVPLPKIYLRLLTGANPKYLDPAVACALIDPSPYAKVPDAINAEVEAQNQVTSMMSSSGLIKIPDYQPTYSSVYDQPHALFGGNMECIAAYLFPLVMGQYKNLNDVIKSGHCGIEYSRGMYNFDQRYLFSFPDPLRGAMVMRFKVPTTAVKGQPMLNKSFEMRYWSVCDVQLENTGYTVGCIKDNEFIRDESDSTYVTLLMTKKNEKPFWACDVMAGQKTNCKINWMPYVGPLTQVYFRQLAPDSSFTNSTMAYMGSTSPFDYQELKRHMETYYPDSQYCQLSDRVPNSCVRILRQLGSVR